jgi:LPS-assembly protein
MRLGSRSVAGVGKVCAVALLIWYFAFGGGLCQVRGATTLREGLDPDALLKSTHEPWEIDAQKLSFDKKNGVYEAEGEVHIYSGDRSLRSEWARFDTQKREAELRGGVFIRYGQDWLKGEYALWNLDSHMGTLDYGLVFFSKNHVYVQGKHIAKVGDSEYELDDGMITSCDPGRPDWSLHFKHMKVDTEGIGWARDTTFWVRGTPVAYTPYILFPANNERQSGFLIPTGGSSKLNGISAELPFYWAVRPDMDVTFYGQYMENRGFMSGAEFRIANPTWGEGIWLFNYLVDQIDKDKLARQGFTFEGKDRYWLRARHNFTLPYEIEGRLDLDLVSDRNYLKEFELGSTSWDVNNAMFDHFFGRGLINDKTIATRESILYLNHREENANIGLDAHYWDNLESGQDKFTLKQMPKLFFDVAPTYLGQTSLAYSLNSSWVNYWRESLTRGERWDFHPRLYYPLHLRPYLDLEPSFGVRATGYGVDWNETPGRDGDSSFQGRVMPDARMELSSTLSRVYAVDWGDLKGVQHVFRPELTYEYMPHVGQHALPFFDPLDRIEQMNDIRYGFSTYLVSKWMRDDQRGEVQTTYVEGVRLRVTQAYNFNEGPPLNPNNLLFDSLLSDIMEADSNPLSERRFSDISFEVDVTPGRYVTFSYDSYVSPYSSEETGRDLMMIMDSTRGHTLIVDYRTRQDPGVNELIGQVRLKVFSGVYLTTLYDYSFLKERTFNQAYGITYEHGCWGVTLAYREEGKDQQVFVSLNLLGLGHLGGGFSPFSSTATVTQKQ